MKIAIIGGGPGGLTLARLLQQKGVDVKVFERDADRHVRVQGGALDLHEESGLAALRAAGLLDVFRRKYRPGADKMKIMDGEGTIYFDQHKEEDHYDFGDEHFRPEIDRGPLRDILLDSLAPGTVEWNSHIVSLTPVGSTSNPVGGWQINFAGGGVAMADIVVGADGANSRIRPYVTSAKPVWAGVTMIEGSVKHPGNTAPRINALLRGGKIFAYGDEKTVIVSGKGDGTLGFTLSFMSEEDWVERHCPDLNDRQQVREWFGKLYAGWGGIWQELLAADDTIFIPRPQYCMPLDLHWDPKPNITLIGDAAHWMPPFAGEGVNMAMLDALQLSESLIGGEGVGHYEAQMFRRFAEVGRITMENTKWMHEPRALGKMLEMFGID
ncbi:MAG: FAD-dependent monooxygenase [Bacteroidetes bacterium]|nr:FAD-dependent monooxygenase [Bacteroidota bacterium]